MEREINTLQFSEISKLNIYLNKQNFVGVVGNYSFVVDPNFGQDLG